MTIGQALRQCPLCKESIRAHTTALIGSIIANPSRQAELELFFKLLEERDWTGISIYREWDPQQDAVRAYAVRCSDGATQLVVFRDTFELLDPGEVYEFRVLSPEEIGSLNKALLTIPWETH